MSVQDLVGAKIINIEELYGDISAITVKKDNKHIRIVGTEDYPFLEKGVLAKNNAEIVERIVDISKYMGREIADPSEARKILGL